MIHRILLTTFLLGIFSSCLYAQTDEYLPGGFVNLSGDTTHGFILDRLKNSGSESFFFKSSAGQAESREYGPGQAAGFFYEPNFRFRAMPVEEDGVRSMRFVRQVVTGYAELYEYNGKSGAGFLLTKASGEVVQLERHDTIVGGRIKSDRRWEGLLKYSLRECQSLLVQGARLEFNQGSLAQYVRRYNRCAHPQTETRLLAAPRKLRVRVGLTAGYSSLKTYIANYNAITPTEPSSGNGLLLGVPVDFFYFERVTLRTGAIYHQYEFVHRIPFSLGSENFYHEFKALEIPFNLRYQLTKGKLSPYLYAGIKVPVFLRKNLIRERVESGNITSRDENDMEFKTLSVFNGGVGLTYTGLRNFHFHLNLGYDQLNAEFPDVRTLETRALLGTLAVMF